ncbi:hypothetical protein L1887_03743 [Cichorium endivia]|nr:hypothetical protein L1887_03743 [Cichorium endivia]
MGWRLQPSLDRWCNRGTKWVAVVGMRVAAGARCLALYRLKRCLLQVMMSPELATTVAEAKQMAKLDFDGRRSRREKEPMRRVRVCC